MPVLTRIATSSVEDATVVRFLDHRVFDDATVREVGDQLLDLQARRRELPLILDFSGVELVSSAMLGKLILLQRRVDAAAGRMRLCELTEGVRAVFRSTNLERLFAIDRDLKESLEQLGG
jgi:anti-sigma B factor antagonist